MEKLRMLPTIIKAVFTPEQQEEIVKELDTIDYCPSPTFLGNFEYSQFRNYRYLPLHIYDVIIRLMDMFNTQVFTTIFIQRYPEGSFVKEHRDPLNNIGKTIIAVFGNFDPVYSWCDEEPYVAESGDIIIQDCTIDGVQGPLHSVEEILHGKRYCIILNTISF